MVKTRFAPSPTGYLHIGGARTALLNWAFARKHGGQFVLRVEDTDAARSTQESSQAIIDSMKWLGLDWDQGPVYQSARTEVYAQAARDLVAAGKAYKCYCGADELAAMRKAQEAAGQKPKYDGRCRDAGDRGDGAAHVIRFKTPQEGRVGWTDAIKGAVSFPNAELDDLVIIRSDGLPTYNFACVVDDAGMGITHVIRGDDHVNNTPRQIHIYEALGQPLPVFAHAPMILGPDGERFSKRHGAESVLAYRDAGILPEALLNFLARLSWGGDGKTEMFDKEAFARLLTLEAVSSHASKYDAAKLAWLGAEHLKAGGPERFVRALGEEDARWLQAQAGEGSSVEKARQVWGPLMERSKTVAEAMGHLRQMASAGEAPAVAGLLPALAAAWSAPDFEWSAPSILASVKEASAQNGLKLGQAMMTLRALLYRTDKTMPLDAALLWLGKERAVAISQGWLRAPSPAAKPPKP